MPEYVLPDLPDDHDPTALVSIRGLTKHFNDTNAANNVSFDIRPGSIVGIVGPNGAGKSTTLSMVTGMLRPDEGSARIVGHDIWKNPDEAKQHLGIVPDRMRVFDRLTGAQLLHYAGVLRGLDADTVRERTTQLADKLGITDALGRLVDNYSSGMMKKLALATALIHAPKVLVLDEPFEAVDPVSVNAVVALLRDFADAGGAVILSSHSLGLIQDLCDEVAVIVEGRVIAAGTIDDVRGDDTLEDRFIALVRDDDTAEDMEWLHTFSA
ncbi:MAG TPA: ABC transporter ATP-binding protein [Terrimesophilobacter sp.]|nr:ABC transporter ATP-binding protein [Terrimesophilobacter sp.]